ncbi:ATP-dependent zn protease [Fusarium longipes]|uniref:ATP-dependent zn protease n=1 Tax=Fusarium longipes TaxID=694270 RepID=A0A395RZE3_9HYPO|nr:ATP-dependent zn protease [Fusarium longipes]
MSSPMPRPIRGGNGLTNSQRFGADSSKETGDEATSSYFDHSSAKRINTDSVFTLALKKQYPGLDLIVVPESQCNLLAFAAAGHATFDAIHDKGDVPSSLGLTIYLPPSRRMDGNKGQLGEEVVFGKFLYRWKSEEFVIYLVDGRDGDESYPQLKNYYILTANVYKAEQLVIATGSWASDLHDEVWVYDQGTFEKDRELWNSAQKSTWDAVILDSDMKEALINDHNSFFESRKTYKDLGVPWKRGLIYHGPPGNGKTISIKATMHMLADRTPTVPTVYVRSLESWMGPQYSLHIIFEKAREFAPCYLVFEDIDSLVTPDVRSYFLNEVDGLKQNDGIFIIASTNHLELLDPGISKRPSRFDRKYYFPDPNLDQREAYCRFWQRKLKPNKEIEFPDELCRAIAEITNKFSFAYIQEAFVATLLAIAGRSKAQPTESSEGAWILVSDDQSCEETQDEDNLDKLELWIEIRKQVKILREGMEDEIMHLHICLAAMETQQQLPYRGAPFPSKWRRNHPRSKNGCLTCRSKRKKCDEAKPVCTGCTRSKQECIWPTPNGDQADKQLGSHSEGVLESHNSIINTSSVSSLVPASHVTTVSSSIRVAPTYGNLAYLSDDSRPLYQQYLDTTADMLTRGPSECGNPFVNYLLPLAASNELVLDCVLAIGGAHLTVNNPTARGLEVATRCHYAKVLAGLQKLLSFEIGQVTPGMVEETTSTRSSQILLILQLLCIYDHIQGNTRGAIYLHLKASREYIATLTSPCQPYDELEYLRGFLLEMYTYHAMKLALSPRNMLREELVEIDPSVHSLDIFSGYKSRGCLLGFGQPLFEMVPQIHQLVEARRQEEKLGLGVSMALSEQYESLVANLEAFDAYGENSEGLRPRQERAGATMIYQNALIVYLHSAFHQDMLADVNLAKELEARIDKTMPAFFSLFVGDSPYRRMLLWPGVIMASCAQRREHIGGFRAGLVGKASQTPGAVKTGARIVDLLWKDPDPRAFGPRGLSYIMTKHDISFGLC